MHRHLFRRDQSLAQQELDMTVIAGARDEAAVPMVIDAAVAHMRPPRGALLHETYRAGRARALLEGELHADAHDLLMRATEGHVQKSERIKQRLRRVPEALEQHALRELRRSRAVGVAAHAVDHHQERRMLSYRCRDAVLILLTSPKKADIGVLDLQEAAFASVRLAPESISPCR